MHLIKYTMFTMNFFLYVLLFPFWLVVTLWTIATHKGRPWNFICEVKRFTKFYANKKQADTTILFPEKNTERPDTQLIKKQLRAFSKISIFETNYGNPKSFRRILIFTGIHGNEFASVTGFFGINKLLKRSNKSVLPNIKLTSPLNIYGYKKNTRFDELGEDLNRNFAKSLNPKIKLQRNLIDNFKPTLVVSFHEGPVNNFLLISEPNTQVQFTNKFLRLTKQQGIILDPFSYLKYPLKTSGLWQKGIFCEVLQRIGSLSSLGMYCQNKGIKCITLETNWNLSLKEREKMQIFILEAILDQKILIN